MLRQTTFLLFFFIAISTVLLAQSAFPLPDRRIESYGEASEDVKAEAAIFTVNIQHQEESDSKSLFERHRTDEKKLYELLHNLSINPQDISGSLMSVNRNKEYSTSNAPPRNVLTTNQQVKFRLTELNKLEVVQLRLIEAGFVSFSASFVNEQLSKQEEKVLTKAIEKAVLKAKAMAIAGKRTFVRVASIQEMSPNHSLMTIRGWTSTGSGQDTNNPPQTITVYKSVRVIVEIQ